MPPKWTAPGSAQVECARRLTFSRVLVQIFAHSRDEDTFNQRIIIKSLDPAIGSMSMSPMNRDIVLGARSGLYIVDLQYPWDVPRFLPGLSTWEIADVQWNVHPARGQWIVSASGHQALVWNLVMQPSASTRNSPIEFILSAHRRSLTDINWSVFETDQLATCALDGWVHTWDLRAHQRPARSYCGWRRGATQVKYNRQDPHLLASAHDGQALVWDSRNGSIPLYTIDAHDTKIYGLDWSRKRSDQIITCSLDKTIKYWHTNDIAKAVTVISTESPVWRARHTPFGDGVLSLPQRAQTALSLWSGEGEAMHRFEGHKSVCKEFVWRTRGGNDLTSDDRDFQLVTWGRDCELHLWPVSQSVLERVAHRKGAPITIRMTRRGYENVSYRQPEEISKIGRHSPSQTMKPAQGLSPIATRGHTKRTSGTSISLTSVDETILSPLLRQNQAKGSAHVPILTPAGAQGFVIRGPRAKTAEVDPITWLSRVSTTATEEPGQSDTSPRLSTSKTEVDKYSLGEEIAAAGRRHGNRVNFEKVQISGRRCTVSCYGPWSSTNSMVFVRMTFHFPPRYPQNKPLRPELNSELSPKVRSVLMRGLMTVASACVRNQASALESCLRFLVGEKTEHDRGLADSDSDDDEESPQLAQKAVFRYNIPMPRRCGVSFGPHDQIALFLARPMQITNTALTEHNRNQSPADMPLQSVNAPQQTNTQSGPGGRQKKRIFESFGVLPGDQEYVDAEAGGSESDDLLRRTSKTATEPWQGSRRMNGLLSSPTSTRDQTRVPFSTTIHIRALDTYHLLQSQIVNDFPVFGDPGEICVRNSATCRKQGQHFVSLIWSTLAEILSTPVADGQRGKAALRTIYSRSSLAEKTLEDMRVFYEFESLPQLRTCCIEIRRRQHMEARQRNLDRKREDAKTSQIKDRSPLATRQSFVQTPSELEDRPNTPIGDTPSQGQSLQRAAASWSSFGAFLSSAGLNLTKTGQSSTSGSPTHRTRQPTLEGAPHLLATIPLRERRASTTISLSPAIMTSTSRNAKSATGAVSAVAARKAPRAPTRGASVTFGSTSVIVPDTPIPEYVVPNRKRRKIVSVRLELSEDDELHRLPAFVLSESTQAELEVARLAYAEMLGRWGHASRRTEVLSLTSAAASDNAGRADGLGLRLIQASAGYDEQTRLAWGHTCQSCGEELRPPHYARCDRCRLSRKREMCVVCHLPLNGLMRSCVFCLHAGHVQCLHDWHQHMRSCASGCGCSECNSNVDGAVAT